MKQALKNFVREAIPVVIMMLVLGTLLVMSISTTFAIWVGIIVGGIIGLGILALIVLKIISSITSTQTAAEKRKSRKDSREVWGYFGRFILIIGGYLLGGLLFMAVPMGLFMLLFPTYDQMVAAFIVIGIVSLILYLLYLAKRGGDLTNVFSQWWL